ncbi:unnamed protein product, partial [Rotaria magnacalcarata]
MRSSSWPILSSLVDSSSFRRCHSQSTLNQNNNNSSSSSSLLNGTTRKSISDLTQQSLSISHTSSMYSSQTSVDMLREDDRTKINKWHYFLAG